MLAHFAIFDDQVASFFIRKMAANIEYMNEKHERTKKTTSTNQKNNTEEREQHEQSRTTRTQTFSDNLTKKTTRKQPITKKDTQIVILFGESDFC